MTKSDLHFDQSLPAIYGRAQRLSPLIERLLAHNPSPFTFRGTGVYLVGDDKHVAVVDPGPNDPEHIKSLLAAIGTRKVEHILITHTHRDHSPAAAELKKITGAKTYAYGPHPRHDGEVEEGGDHDFTPDVIVRDGDVVASGICHFQCVFTPGHTSNHMCYALKEEQALFTGDHVMGWSTTVVAPPDGNMGDYMKSLGKVIARKDHILYPTHGSPIVKPGPFLRAYLSHRKMREHQIVRAIGRGKNTVPLLVETLYAGLSPSLLHAARLTVEAHLAHMTGDKRVKALPDGFYEVGAMN